MGGGNMNMGYNNNQMPIHSTKPGQNLNDSNPYGFR
jgi:hypothetical protein